MWFFSPLFSRFKTMTLCRSSGELGGARRRDEQSQCRLGCSVGRSRFFSGGHSTNSVCGLLQGTGHFRQRRISLGLSLIPLWRDRLSIALTHEKGGLEP